MDGPKYLTDIQVTDIEKRTKPSKHYVYVIWTTWSNNDRHLIYRRYSQFFDLQCKLFEHFKVESGHYDPTKRIIPFLPGKILFGRSHVKSVALDRLHPIGVYCKKLITLKSEISRNSMVLDFFNITNDDISQASSKSQGTFLTKNDSMLQNISEPIRNEEYICVHTYKALSKNELSIKKDSKCFVIEKSLNGWWFIDTADGQGYVPQCVIMPLNYSPEITNIIKIESPEMHIVNRDFVGKKSDELTLTKGEFVYVLEKNLNGWWKSKKETDSSVGLAPAVYLEPVNQSEISLSQKFSIPAFDLFTNACDRNSTTSFDNLGRSSSFSSSFSVDNDPILANKNRPSENLVKEDIYYAIESYQDLVGDGIDVFKGQTVNVLKKDHSTGWWYVIKSDLTEGWAPSAYLSKTKPHPPPRPKLPDKSKYIHFLNKNSDNEININKNLMQFESNNNNNNNGEIYDSSLVSLEEKEDSKEAPEMNSNQIKVSDLRKMFEKN